ncbi:bifunctional 2-polyprenyl-6-hydroxyphenol methylase/3-demethylubiquinol 3-O-methyltransferase UbiG [Pandoraea sp. ISTKB]|uniref:class I SAM-dependent methyltransferase n=1 Tax=Pandoraea sp. ISTKB TaxID=1586708 RepID=UPI0008474598|nr:class I SAM-dependent methyltransferase [Pandoraea sp. ISTKB]ODP33971.1 SAM-dependent methyltransferase [Pandoraea sp. ISTKB]
MTGVVVPEVMHGTGAPSPWLMRWAHLIAPGTRALDVACGHGRHSRWLASRGVNVTAIDRDEAALATMSTLAGVTTVSADLEGAPWPLPADATFDAVIVTNYLHRPLLARIAASVAPGGVLIYETFAQGNERYGKPSNPLFLLAPGELLDVAREAGLRVAGFEDVTLSAPRAACVQRLCATRASTPGENPGTAALYEATA